MLRLLEVCSKVSGSAVPCKTRDSVAIDAGKGNLTWVGCSVHQGSKGPDPAVSYYIHSHSRLKEK